MFGLPLSSLKLAAWLVLGLSLLGFASYVRYEWTTGQHAKQIVHQAQVVQKQQTAAIRQVDKPAAQAERAAQVKIVYRYRTLIKEIPTYVTKTSPCIPWGVVRVLDAPVIGVDPSSLHPPTGQSDDACSDVDPATFARTVVTNYQTAQQNAEQLNALEDDLNKRASRVSQTKSP